MVADECKLSLLGPPRFEKSGQPVRLKLRKAVAIVTYLAVENRQFSRDFLAALFWPGFGQRSALSDLRRTLSVIRSALGTECIETDGDQVALNHDLVLTDVDEFHKLSRSESDDPALLEQAIHLYRGSFLEGFNIGGCLEFDRWQDATRQRLQWEADTLLETVSRGYLESGNPELALPHAWRWLGLDEWNEAAHRTLMEIFARTGRRTAAQQQYAACVRLLEREGIEPDDLTRELNDAIVGNRLDPVVEHFPSASVPEEEDDDYADGEVVGRSASLERPGDADPQSDHTHVRPIVITGQFGGTPPVGKAETKSPSRKRPPFLPIHLKRRVASIAALATVLLAAGTVLGVGGYFSGSDLKADAVEVLYNGDDISGVVAAFRNEGRTRRHVQYSVVFSPDRSVGTVTDFVVYRDEVRIARNSEMAVEVSSKADIQLYVETNRVRIPPGYYYLGVFLDPELQISEATRFNNRVTSSDRFFYGGAAGVKVIEVDVRYSGADRLDSDNPLRVFIGDLTQGARGWEEFVVSAEGRHFFTLDQIPDQDTDNSGYYMMIVHDVGNNLPSRYEIGTEDVPGLYREGVGNVVYGGFATGTGTPVFAGERYTLDFRRPPIPEPDIYEPDDIDPEGTYIDYNNDLPVGQYHTFHSDNNGDTDGDWFRVFLRAGDSLTVETFSAGGQWESDTAVDIFDSSMAWIDGNNDKAFGNNYSMLSYLNDTGSDQQFHIHVGEFTAGDPGRWGEYRVEFRE